MNKWVYDQDLRVWTNEEIEGQIADEDMPWELKEDTDDVE